MSEHCGKCLFNGPGLYRLFCLSELRLLGYDNDTFTLIVASALRGSGCGAYYLKSRHVHGHVTVTCSAA